MKNTRRKFIQNASLAILGASLKPSALWSATNKAVSKNLIGVQLYSVREDMSKKPLELSLIHISEPTRPY